MHFFMLTPAHSYVSDLIYLFAILNIFSSRISYIFYIPHIIHIYIHICIYTFLGGRVNHAIYFVGYNSNNNGNNNSNSNSGTSNGPFGTSGTSNGTSELLGLDPHSVFSATREEPFPSAELVSQVHVSGGYPCFYMCVYMYICMCIYVY